MAEQVYLAVDIGAESGRVIAGGFDGKTVSLDEAHRFANGPVSVADTMRWDVLRLWTEIQNGLAKVAAGGNRDAIASIGVDTWGVDYVLLSDTGEMLGQPYNYRDDRTRGEMAAAFSVVPREEIFRETGLQFMEINTLYQLLAMRRSNPQLLDVADAFLMMPDFFHWLLCGSLSVEFTNATTSQCFHPTTGDWSRDLLEKFDLPVSIFGDVVEPGTNLGRLREDVAGRTGLGRVDVVAPAAHDTGAAVAAVPTENTGRADWAYISSGTWSLIGVEVADAVLTDQALAWNVTNEGGFDRTYRLLKNVMGLWLVQECRRSFERGGNAIDYGELTQLAGDAAPFASLVDPDDGAFLNPDDMPQALRKWCRAHGETPPESEGAIVRCALESLALKYRFVLERLETLTGVKVEVIHIVGGGSQNELLNQFTANACGRPVVAGPVEATALGNVLVQARAAGEVSSLAEIRDVVRASTDAKRFDPRSRDAWENAYGRFRRLIESPK